MQANSSLNIRDGSALYNEKDKIITKSIFGDIAKDNSIGAGVLRQYGKGSSGFSVSSCQFALHYFFENNPYSYLYIYINKILFFLPNKIFSHVEVFRF